jgi:hypothetical protein
MEIGEYQGGYSTPIWIFRFFIPLAAVSFLLVVVNQFVSSIIELRNFRNDADTDVPADTDGIAVQTQA